MVKLGGMPAQRAGMKSTGGVRVVRCGLRMCCWIMLVLSAGLWAVSERWTLEYDSLDVLVAHDELRITLWRGAIGVWYDRSPMGFDLSQVLNTPQYSWASATASTYLDIYETSTYFRNRQWGPRWRIDLYRGLTPRYVDMSLPAWIPLLVALVGLAFTRRKRVLAGRCAKCRYDVSQSTLAVCPECGSEIEREVVSG